MPSGAALMKHTTMKGALRVYSSKSTIMSCAQGNGNGVSASILHMHLGCQPLPVWHLGCGILILSSDKLPL